MQRILIIYVVVVGFPNDIREIRNSPLFFSLSPPIYTQNKIRFKRMIDTGLSNIKEERQRLKEEKEEFQKIHAKLEQVFVLIAFVVTTTLLLSSVSV